MRVQQFFLAPTAVALLAALSLAACDRSNEDRTVGQTVDSTIAKVEKKSDQAATAMKKEADAAMASADKGISTAGDKVKDVAITTAVNAELARDSALSPLKINVDTDAGHVALHGTAPSTVAKERATTLAQAVDGVVSVDNQLRVQSN